MLVVKGCSLRCDILSRFNLLLVLCLCLIFSMGTLCKFWHGGPPAIRLLVGQTNDVSSEWLEFCPRNKMSQPLQIIQSTCLTFVSSNRFIIMPLSQILYFFAVANVFFDQKFLWNFFETLSLLGWFGLMTPMRDTFREIAQKVSSSK